MKEELICSSFCYTFIMKRIFINLIIPIIVILLFLLSSNFCLYDKKNLKSKNIIILNSNKEKVINLKNRYNKDYIYNFYITNYKYKLDSIKIYVNNKLIDSGDVKNNNYIIYRTILEDRNNKSITIKIKSRNKEKYIIYFDKLEKNMTLIKHIKSKTSKKTYYIDTDSAKEMYRIGDSYKYVGNVPNNYICFNCKNNSLLSCEMWRIIGIVKINNNEYLKIIKNNSIKYDNKHYNIYDGNKSLIKNNSIELLDIEDYIDSYKNVNRKCIKDIYKCNSKSYLTPRKEEMIDAKSKIYSISNKGYVIKSNKTIMYRPVLYLKNKVIILGGNGSYNRPYFIK